MGQLTLVLGGIRSGKSRLAEQLAAVAPPVTYLATAQDGGDAEMVERIARHRQRRAALTPPWRTVEESWDVPAAVAVHGQSGCVLVECLTLWLTNLLLGVPGRTGLSDTEVVRQIESLAQAGQAAAARVIVVSNEVGCGIVPANALARRFSDLLGDANQRLAATATEVYGCLAGIALRVKPR